MAQITSYDGVPLVDAIVIGPDGQPGYSQTAKLGEPGFSNVIVDDPEGVFTFETWKDWTVDEDDCAFERLYTGIVYAIRVDRGPYRDGPGRKWYLDIVDQGQLLKQRVISGADGLRPFEMDTVRINWLYNSDYLDGLVFDNGFLNVTDNPQGMFDTDHRFEYPMDVFVSVAGPISKHAFVYWDGVAEQSSIFYDRFDVSLGAAGIGFSNVMSDVDETTVFYPKVDAEATYDGEDRYGGLMLGWRGPSVYRTLPSTVTAMGRTRDVTFQTDRIGLASTASSVTDLLLAQHADDLVSIKFSAELPSSAVRLAREGQTLEVRFSHIPGFETTQEVFIRSTIVQQIVAGRYLVQYDVAPNPTVPLVPTGGNPGELPPVGCDADDIVIDSGQTITDDIVSGDLTLPGTPTSGNLQVAFTAWQDPFPANSITPDDFTDITGIIDVAPAHQNFRAQGWYRIAQTGDTTTLSLTTTGTSNTKRIGYVEFAGVSSLDSFDTEEFQTAGNVTGSVTLGTVTPPAGTPCLLVFGMVPALNVNDGFSAVADHADDVEDIDYGVAAGQAPYMWLGHRIIASPSGSYSPSITVSHGGAMRGYGTFVAVFICSELACLTTGQPSPEDEPVNETPDGVIVTFTTRCPFADDSLHVKVDNTDQTGAIVSYDGAAGEFTLGFAPPTGCLVTVNYLGR